MPARIPFTRILHNPTKPELVLANGRQFLIVNTSNGDLIRDYPKNEERLQDYAECYKCMAFNADGSLLATVSDSKEMRLWNTNDWSLKSTRPLHHRVNAMQFTHNGTQVVVADKFGDVYCHPTEEANENETSAPIVGHVSMLSDMTLSTDGKYVITADRDEHIRVSRFPNGYNIESFCLGHTEIVTCIRILPWATDMLASAGGDHTIRLWDYLKGAETQCLDIRSHIEEYIPGATVGGSEPMISKLALGIQCKSVVVAFTRIPALLVLTWDETEKQLVYKETLQLDSPVLDIAFDLESKLWVSMAPVDDDKDLLAVFRLHNQQFERVASENALLQQVTAAKAGLAETLPDLYSAFRRKVIDFPERGTDVTEQPETAAKRQKV